MYDTGLELFSVLFYSNKKQQEYNLEIKVMTQTFLTITSQRDPKHI
jgi:hypothetical protein